MSTIVVARKGKFATIASDSQVTAGSLVVPPEHKVNTWKIYQVENAYVGMVGWSATGDILEDLIRRHPDKLNFTNRTTIFETLIGIQELLVSDYFINPQEEEDQPVNSNQMNGVAISPRGIFSFSSYRNVNEYARFWAAGSGKEFALGAMQVSYDLMESSEAIARAGVESGCVFDDGSCLPVQMVTIELEG